MFILLSTSYFKFNLRRHVKDKAKYSYDVPSGWAEEVGTTPHNLQHLQCFAELSGLLQSLLFSCYGFGPVCPGPFIPFAHTHNPLPLL